MSKKKDPSHTASNPPGQTTIYEATLGANGSVVRGKPISQVEAEDCRRNGMDVVVCGPDLAANRRLAGTIELNANGSAKRCPPHANAGRDVLPHFQPDPGRRPVTPSMKRQTEEQDDRSMKFFTPQLYRRYNSPDDAEADQANEEWEKKLLEYRSYITKHSSGMNDRVRQLAASACLHDSELLSIQEDELEPRPPRFPFFPYSVATVSVSQGGKITNVIYFLWSGIEQSGPDDEWTFSKLRTHWLFDEIEVEKAPLAPLYWHKILWSDGRTVFIPFFDVILQSYSPQDPETAIIAKKHA